MIPLFLADLPTVGKVCACATYWALLCGAAGLWLVLPTRWRLGKVIGTLLLGISGGLIAYDLPKLGDWTSQAVFWLLAAIILGAGVATIASQSPVYSAIWFALSLLGTAGLFVFQGAQFLGGATVVVYAGAIVVTFLFVIMLAQPEGHSQYDRLTWGGLPKVLAVVTAALLVGILTFMLGRLKNEAVKPVAATAQTASGMAESGGVLDPKHVANVGRVLFSQHLISLEVAGTLLLVALVGAVAIAIYGKPRLAERIEEALR